MARKYLYQCDTRDDAPPYRSSYKRNENDCIEIFHWFHSNIQSKISNKIDVRDTPHPSDKV